MRIDTETTRQANKWKKEEEIQKNSKKQKKEGGEQKIVENGNALDNNKRKITKNKK